MHSRQVLYLLDITRIEHNTNTRKLFKIFKCISQAILAREQVIKK